MVLSLSPSGVPTPFPIPRSPSNAGRVRLLQGALEALEGGRWV